MVAISAHKDEGKVLEKAYEGVKVRLDHTGSLMRTLGEVSRDVFKEYVSDVEGAYKKGGGKAIEHQHYITKASTDRLKDAYHKKFSEKVNKRFLKLKEKQKIGDDDISDEMFNKYLTEAMGGLNHEEYVGAVRNYFVDMANSRVSAREAADESKFHSWLIDEKNENDVAKKYRDSIDRMRSQYQNNAVSHIKSHNLADIVKQSGLEKSLVDKDAIKQVVDNLDAGSAYAIAEQYMTAKRLVKEPDWFELLSKIRGKQFLPLLKDYKKRSEKSKKDEDRLMQSFEDPIQKGYKRIDEAKKH